MNHKETCEKIVAKGDCGGVWCRECPFTDGEDPGCSCFALDKSGWGAIVKQAKEWLLMNTNKMPELKSGYVVRAGGEWFNIIDNDGDLTAFNAEGSYNTSGIGEIIEILQYQRGIFRRAANDVYEMGVTNPIWKKDDLQEVPVSELIALYEKEKGVKIKVSK